MAFFVSISNGLRNLANKTKVILHTRLVFNLWPFVVLQFLWITNKPNHKNYINLSISKILALWWLCCITHVRTLSLLLRPRGVSVKSEEFAVKLLLIHPSIVKWTNVVPKQQQKNTKRSTDVINVIFLEKTIKQTSLTAVPLAQLRRTNFEL